MNKVNSTLLRSSGTLKMLMNVLNMSGRVRFSEPVTFEPRNSGSAEAGRYHHCSLLGDSPPSTAAGAAAAGVASSAGAADFLPPTFFSPARFTNFFLGLGNSKASPLRFCADPPDAVMRSWADLLYQPAITFS